MKKVFTLLFLYLVVFSCNSEEKHSFETKVVQAYLKEVQQPPLSEQEETIILIPLINCRACVQRGLITLDQQINSPQAHMRMLYCGNFSIPQKLTENIQVYHDSYFKLDGYNIDLESINILKIENESIVAIEGFNAENIEDFSI